MRFFFTEAHFLIEDIKELMTMNNQCCLIGAPVPFTFRMMLIIGTLLTFNVSADTLKDTIKLSEATPRAPLLPRSQLEKEIHYIYFA